MPAFLSRYLVLLTLLLGVAFAVHSWLRGLAGLGHFEDQLPACYLLNYILAAAIVSSLFAVRRKARNLIGFLFIGGGLLKFLLFFLLLYPDFNADDQMSRTEFLSFFVPYFLALSLETVFTAKMLRVLEREDAR